MGERQMEQGSVMGFRRVGKAGVVEWVGLEEGEGEASAHSGGGEDRADDEVPLFRRVGRGLSGGVTHALNDGSHVAGFDSAQIWTDRERPYWIGGLDKPVRCAEEKAVQLRRASDSATASSRECRGASGVLEDDAEDLVLLDEDSKVVCVVETQCLSIILSHFRTISSA